MTDPANTTAADLQRAAKIGREAGLRFVYAGNLPGRVGDLEDTRCPSCSDVLIARYGYLIREYNLTKDGACPRCSSKLPGRWSTGFEGQRTSHPFLPTDRTRLSVF